MGSVILNKVRRKQKFVQRGWIEDHSGKEEWELVPTHT